MKLRFQITCLLLLVSFFQPLFAQDYNPLPRNLTQLYSYLENGSSDTSFFAARIDSVAQEGPDSAFYLYRILRHPQPTDTILDCGGVPASNSFDAYLLSQDHYFGQRMVRSSSGLCRFIASAGSEYDIESQAAVGASWTFHAGITASLDSIVYAPVLGQMDSVKYINLSDGRQLQLSQHFGFVRSFPFLPYYTYGAPDMPVFTLWGIPEAGIGEHLPSIAEIFEFENGAKIQMKFENNPNFGSWSLTRYTETIFGQLVPGPLLQYDVTRESAEIISAPPAPTTSYSPSTAGTWTLDSTQITKLHYLPFETPDSIFEGNTTGLQIGIHRSIHNGRIAFDFYASDFYDSCANFIYLFERQDRFTYTEGLGLTYSGRWDETGSEVERLLCYVIGIETYGICQDLGVLYSAKDAIEASVILYPNPVNNELRVAITDNLNFAASNVAVIGLDGREYFSSDIKKTSNQLEIPTADFPSGIYLLRIEKAGYQPMIKRFVVQH